MKITIKTLLFAICLSFSGLHAIGQQSDFWEHLDENGLNDMNDSLTDISKYKALISVKSDSILRQNRITTNHQVYKELKRLNNILSSDDKLKAAIGENIKLNEGLKKSIRKSRQIKDYVLSQNKKLLAAAKLPVSDQMKADLVSIYNRETAGRLVRTVDITDTNVDSTSIAPTESTGNNESYTSVTCKLKIELDRLYIIDPALDTYVVHDLLQSGIAGRFDIIKNGPVEKDEIKSAKLLTYIKRLRNFDSDIYQAGSLSFNATNNYAEELQLAPSLGWYIFVFHKNYLYYFTRLPSCMSTGLCKIPYN